MKRISAFLLLLLAINAGAQTISRKVNFIKGQQFEMVVSNKTESTYDMGDHKGQVSNQLILYFFVTVTDVKDKLFILDNKLIRRELKIKVMDREQNLDSDSAADALHPTAGKALMEAIGETFRVKVDEAGNALGVENLSKKDNSIAAPGSLDATMKSSWGTGGRYDLTAPLPFVPIRLGETWADSSGSKINAEVVTCKLERIENGIATVSHSGKISSEASQNNGGMDALMKLEGTSVGEFSFDVKSGLLIHSINNIDSKGAMDIAGKALPMTLKRETSLKVKPPKS
jgi:hypothetical protein